MQRPRTSDIFRTALTEERILPTFDLDFSDLAALARDERARIMIFRLANTRVENVIRRLTAVLAESGEVFRHGVIVVVDRIRYLPIGEAGN